MIRESHRSQCLAETRATRLTPESERRLRIADENPSGKYEHAADDNLERRLQERRIHVARADPGYDCKLDRHHREGDNGRAVEMRNKVGKGVPEPAERSHDPAHGAA